MDEKKILFFTCVNNENLYKLCVHHIRGLAVPEGFTVQVMSSSNAPGMAKGYNLALARSDAKYKVYLHQDTLIVKLLLRDKPGGFTR